MKMPHKIILTVLSIVLLSAHTSFTDGESTKPKINVNEVSGIGIIDTLRYDVNVNGKIIEKKSLVYMPSGYDPSDKDTRYNVLYLAHGGGDNIGSFFSTKRTPNPLNIIADSLINEGKMNPIIIVSVTYYPPEEIGISKGMDSTINYVRNFHRELRESIIPSVGKKYNTYLQSFNDSDITATRGHRAYGGFSMGALSTWYQLAFDPHSFCIYLPLSGDLWVYEDNGEKVSSDDAAKWLNDRISESKYNSDDINIYAYSGTKDIAFMPESKLVESIKNYCPILKYSPNPDEGNLHFHVEMDGIHNYEWISKYLKDAMPRLWDKTSKSEEK